MIRATYDAHNWDALPLRLPKTCLIAEMKAWLWVLLVDIEHMDPRSGFQLEPQSSTATTRGAYVHPSSGPTTLKIHGHSFQDNLESRVAHYTRPPYPEVAHNSLKLAHHYRPLAFQEDENRKKTERSTETRCPSRPIPLRVMLCLLAKFD